MPLDTRLVEVDPRAASDEKLITILKLCGNLKWFANLLEKSWTQPATQINKLDSDPEQPYVLAIPDVVQSWLDCYRPQIRAIRLGWSTQYPIADYWHYPSSLAPWLTHLLEGVETLLGSTPDSESEGVKVSNSLVRLAKRLEIAATNPLQALASQIAKDFEIRRGLERIEEFNRRQSDWRSAPSPRYDDYVSPAISAAEPPIESTATEAADAYKDDSLLSPPRLAEVLNVHPERMSAFCKMLERHRMSLGSGGFQELKDVPMHQHKYVYRLGSVRGLAGRYQEAPRRRTKSRADVRPKLF